MQQNINVLQRAEPPATQAVAAATALRELSTDIDCSSTDHIITISTASITEVHTDEDTEELKYQEQQRQQSNNIHTLTVAISPPSIASSVGAHATASHTSKQKVRSLCHLSQLVSFQNNIADVHHRRGRRLHGLQLPLHPLQLFGWLVLVLFGLASYCVLIPAFNAELQGPLYGLISGLYVVHIASHLTALLTDPADKELRRVHRNDRIVPEFDRSKHNHVIENGRCHLCNIRTSSPRTKHCSVCNKCVGKFDHHCKWLNHCVGSRNYVAFLMCVVSAVVATLVIVAAVIAQIVFYYVQPEWLSYYWCGTNDASHAGGGAAASAAGDISIGSLDMNALNVASLDSTLTADGNGSDYFINVTLSLGNGSMQLLEEEQQQQQDQQVQLQQQQNVTVLPTLMQNFTTLLQQAETTLATLPHGNRSANQPTIAGIGINETIFLILIGMLGLLAAISAGLLLHLCFFHIYISFLGLTTYEYIRNHRQAQEAKAKQLVGGLPITLPKNGVHFSPMQMQPSKRTSNDCAQIYCCASVRHPNAETNYLDARSKQHDEQQRLQQIKLHCCADSREHYQRANRAYYVCSLLDEPPRSDSPMTLAAQHYAGIAPYDNSSFATALDAMEQQQHQQQLRSFHCCSSFAASSLQRRLSAVTAKATLVGDVEAAAAAAATLSSARTRSYLQYTEQCTFCTFRLRSPLMTTRHKNSCNSNVSSSTASNSTRTLASQQQQSTAAAAASTAAAAEREHQRCCMKSISKQQRWRRKWNCCTSVPDSPDVPNDLLTALALRHQQAAEASASAKINVTELPVQFIRSMDGAAGCNAHHAGSATIKSQATAAARARNARTWPVARLRHMMRMLGRRPRCRHHHHANNATAAAAAGPGGGITNLATVAAAEQHANIKQNQIRPLQLQARGSNGFGVGIGVGGYYDSSTPQPASSATPTPSELSSELEPTSTTLYSSSEGSTTPTDLMILPTSVIRDDSVTTYTLTLPPALPPPTRRKMPNPTDLEELAETLGFVTHSAAATYTTQQQQQRLPALGNVYRRQRRKHFLRTRSPTLSPIHESGLSNPTSPQPGRHNYNNANSISNSNNCSPAVARSTALVNNLCSIAGEALRKASSNTSLQSVSSNSSST